MDLSILLVSTRKLPTIHNCVCVGVGPVFTVMPEALLVFEGASVTLSCEAEGFPPPTFSWYRFGSLTPISITGESTPGLTVRRNYSSSCAYYHLV